MMPLRRRAFFIPTRSCMQLKFIVNRVSTVNKNLLFVDDLSLKESKKNTQKRTPQIKPIIIKPESNKVEVGAELGGHLSKTDISSVIDSFLGRNELEVAALEKGLSEDMYKKVQVNFTQYCLNTENLSSDLHIVLCDIVNGHGHVLDLVPYFLQHALLMYPHLKYKEELYRTGDLTSPEIWYAHARSYGRKIFVHYGPTNSGKTYKALEKFFKAERGIYCAPLKLLAHEIFENSNKRGIPCDLVTGEEIRKVCPDGSDAKHVSCTVEMTCISSEYDVAVIDEIQMIQDLNRGYAWTRAFLGLPAKEIHLCGEAGALQYIEEAAGRLGEPIQSFRYKRFTKLYLENEPVEQFKNIQDGDCIICFSKKEIFQVSRALEELKIPHAIIYGTLPPGTKAYQCNKFNDPTNECNVLVATDAIGLGLNLNIRRIIFFSLERKDGPIPVSHALQIAGRAGRYHSRYDKGFVTTFKRKDMKILKELMNGDAAPVVKAGLFPTAEQIETFSYYLPTLSFTELIDIFSALCTVNEKYFMCELGNFKRLACLIEHMQLSIHTIFVFCCSPVNSNSLLCQTLFVRFAKKYSLNEAITVDFMKKFLDWPFKKPLNMGGLELLEETFDCLDLYLWFGNRFPSLFPDCDLVRNLQEELDNIILETLNGIQKLVKTTTRADGLLTAGDMVNRGMISPDLLAQLKSEWLKEMKSKGSTS